MRLKRTIEQTVIWYDIDEIAYTSMDWYPRDLCRGLSLSIVAWKVNSFHVTNCFSIMHSPTMLTTWLESTSFLLEEPSRCKLANFFSRQCHLELSMAEYGTTDQVDSDVLQRLTLGFIDGHDGGVSKRELFSKNGAGYLGIGVFGLQHDALGKTRLAAGGSDQAHKIAWGRVARMCSPVPLQTAGGSIFRMHMTVMPTLSTELCGVSEGLRDVIVW